jgi:hypothetical protein
MITESWFNSMAVENIAGVFSGLKIKPFIWVSFDCTWLKLLNQESWISRRKKYLEIFISVLIKIKS